MKVAFGLKAHSGWAALVVLGTTSDGPQPNHAAEACDLRLARIPEKQLDRHAARALGTPAGRVKQAIVSLGKTVGPPWGKDQKDAALAAMIALRGRRDGTPGDRG